MGRGRHCERCPRGVQVRTTAAFVSLTKYRRRADQPVVPGGLFPCLANWPRKRPAVASNRPGRPGSQGRRRPARTPQRRGRGGNVAARRAGERPRRTQPRAICESETMLSPPSARSMAGMIAAASASSFVRPAFLSRGVDRPVASSRQDARIGGCQAAVGQTSRAVGGQAGRVGAGSLGGRGGWRRKVVWGRRWPAPDPRRPAGGHSGQAVPATGLDVREAGRHLALAASASEDGYRGDHFVQYRDGSKSQNVNRPSRFMWAATSDCEYRFTLSLWTLRCS